MPAKPPITLNTDTPIWNRQPRETDKHYARFLVYRDLGEGRTLNATLEILNSTNDTAVKTIRTLQMVAHEFRWTERVQAYDRHMAAVDRERLASLRRDMIERHRKLATGLIAKAAASMVDLNKESLAPVDIARFISLGTELERKALGEPDTKVAVTGPTGHGPMLVEDLSQYSGSERRARLAAIAEELARRAAINQEGEDE